MCEKEGAVLERVLEAVQPKVVFGVDNRLPPFYKYCLQYEESNGFRYRVNDRSIRTSLV